MFLNDQETATDLLYYSAIAETVVKLIDETPEAPITIGVHGDWGAGKSSVLKMLQAACENKDKTLCIWFNGWTFEGFEDAKTVIIETLVEELVRARPGCTKVAAAANKVLRRVDWLKLARKTGGLALSAFTGIPTMEQLKGVLDIAAGLISNPQETLSAEGIKAFVGKAGDFIKEADTEQETLPKHIHAFRNEFSELLKEAQIDKLVVIVDDLDRCLPETAIDTLEAIRLFLFVEKTAFVIGADEAMIEYAVRNHFPDLPQSQGPLSYARNYLEKLIQVPFRIPALGSLETRVYTTLLLVENALGPTHKQFTDLLEKAREEMQRPWLSSGLDRKVVSEVLKHDIPEPVDQALLISAHVTPLLNAGTRGNPRQIKRFLNSMMLRQAIAEARGFGDEMKRPVLAKIMLAERFYPAFYEQIVREVSCHNKGKPEVLAQFEEQARGATDSEKEEEAQHTQLLSSDQFDIAVWMKNGWAVDWARTEPRLADEDLRPYVFVTRDKQSLFEGALTTSHLEPLIEKLMGPRIAVAGLKAPLEKLSAPEADEVFEALCNPYAFKTKGEMALECRDQQFIRQHASNTMSCSSPQSRRYDPDPAERAPKHCGRCVPCLIRRASLHAAFHLDETPYRIPDLNAQTLDSRKAEGEHVRAFQLSLAQLATNPERAKFDIHKPGPLSDHPGSVADYVGVYTRGMKEVGNLLNGVVSRPKS